MCVAGSLAAGEGGRRRQHLGADPVGLHGLHDRPRRSLAGRAAGHEGREFAHEGHALLEQQPALGRPLVGQPLREVPGTPRDEHALPS